MKTRVLLSIIAASSTAHASTLLNFDGTNYVTATNLMQSNGLTSYYSGASITPLTNYSGPAFFGGWSLSSGSISVNAIADNSSSAGGRDPWRFRSSSIATNETAFNLMVFAKGQFSDPQAQTNGFTLNSSSSFTLGASRVGGQTLTDATNGTGLRWVLQSGTNFYISALNNSAAAQFGLGYTNLASGDLTGLSWFNYNPATSISAIGSTASLNFETLVFDSAGVLYKAARVTSSGNIEMQYGQFLVDATAVPEPSTVALLASSLAALTALRRRRD